MTSVYITASTDELLTITEDGIEYTGWFVNFFLKWYELMVVLENAERVINWEIRRRQNENNSRRRA
jgi:hypothetical protein